MHFDQANQATDISLNANGPWVKLCGITRVEDALAARTHGINAIGLVFVQQSPRFVDLDQAKRLVDRLQGTITTVGLFMDAPTDWIREVIADVGLDWLQFHGRESGSFCESFGLPYLKAIGAKALTASQSSDALSQDQWLEQAKQYRSAQALLIDSHGSGEMGGSGQISDWDRLRDVTERLDRPWVLAGGLNAANVAQALAVLSPAGIDLSSGVESQPGIKDHGKIEQFMGALAKRD